jgi:hypothetical protein
LNGISAFFQLNNDDGDTSFITPKEIVNDNTISESPLIPDSSTSTINARSQVIQLSHDDIADPTN